MAEEVAQAEDTSVENELEEMDGIDPSDIEASDADIEEELKDSTEEADELDINDDEETETEDETDESDKTEETDTEDEETTDEPELSAEEQKKQHNREMAEKRLQDKAQREAQIKAQQDQYVAEAEDPRDIALRQLQVDAYNNRVDRNTGSLKTAFDRAVADFDILRDTDPVIQREVDSAIDAFQAQYVKIDTYGNPTDVNGDFYKYLETKANSIAALTGKGARQQEQSKAKQKSKTLTLPSRQPKQAKGDPGVDAFEEEASRW